MPVNFVLKIQESLFIVCVCTDFLLETFSFGYISCVIKPAGLLCCMFVVGIYPKFP